MVPTGNRANQHRARTVPATDLSNERLCNCGIIFYRTDLLGGNVVRIARSLPSFIVKRLNFTVFAVTIFGTVKSKETFSFARNAPFSVQIACLSLCSAHKNDI